MTGRRGYEAARGQSYLPQRNIGMPDRPSHISGIARRMLFDSCVTVSSALCLAC